MATINQNSDQQLSQVVFAWQHLDHVAYIKDKRWYILSVIVLALVVAWSVWDKNYLFAVFLVMFYMVVLLYANRQPEMVDFIITPLGVKSGSKFHAWNKFSDFYIIYRAEGIKNLYLEFVNPISGRLIVPLDGQNAVAIRQYLLKFLAEDLEREAEPLSEQLRRWLRI